MVRLGQNIKLTKKHAKNALQAHEIVLWKKRLENNSYYLKNETILKTGENDHCLSKMLSLGQKLKLSKRCEKLNGMAGRNGYDLVILEA